MDEKTFEDIICEYPELIEENLKFKGRQVVVKGKRVDVLFEDRRGQLLILEVKKGAIRRDHLAQIFDYEGEYVSPDDPNVRVMLVGNRVPENLRRSLDHHGFEWKELTITFLCNFLKGKGDIDLLSRVTSIEPIMHDTINTGTIQSRISHQDTPFLDNPTTPIIENTSNINSPTEAPNISFLKKFGYYDSEINDLQRATYTFYQVVLPRKILRETKAGDILHRLKGNYNEDILNNVFDMIDKDPTGPWFGPTLSKPNRNNLFRNPMAELNVLINNLLESGDLAGLGRWRHAGNRGMNKGMATLLMYIYSPESCNVWLNKTHEGLLRLGNFEAESPQKELSAENCSIYYQRFNKTAIAVRKEYGFTPQAMDWFLWAIGEIKENPSNKYFTAYRDSRTK